MIHFQISRIANSLANLFVVWIALAAGSAYLWPGAFAWFGAWIVPALGIVMFGMGVTLTTADFKRVRERPYPVFIGTVAQFAIMPLTGAILAKIFGVAPPIAAGLVLVGACPGGTASNVITFLAKADVALAVTLTAVTTLLGVVATPYLTKWYAGQYVQVDAPKMLVSVLLIVVIPVALGLAVRHWSGDRSRKISGAVMPLLSVVIIAMIVASIVAGAKSRLVTAAPITFLAVILHNLIGMILGYGLARLAGLDKIQARTISIEVSVQDSGLGIALARKHFADVLVALPSAIFSLWQNISGPLVAVYWSRKGGMVQKFE